MAQAEDMAAVLELEKQRIDAVNAGDADAIEPLFADDIMAMERSTIKCR
jgi:ketosteroid isomerase-like protein